MKIVPQWQKLLLPNPKSGKAAIFWAAVFSGIWLLLQDLCGLLLGYRTGSAPGAACTLALLGILARELLRTLLSNLPKSRRFGIGLGIAVAFAFGECILTAGTTAVWKSLSQEFLPTLSRSALLTALAMHGGLLPALLYGLTAQSMGLWIPTAPALSHQMAALLELVLNMMFLVVLDCDLSPDEVPTKHRPKAHIASGVATGAILATLVCFFAGLLPWQPVAIATGSMEPQISVGDMVLVSKLDTDALEIGDVIQFRSGSYTVIHRIVAVMHENGTPSYITKGDANNANDAGTVSFEDVVGKVVATVPGAGRWALWLHGA